MDIGSTFATGLTVGAYDKLRRGLDIKGDTIRLRDPVQMLAELEIPVLEAIGSDVRS